MSPARSAVLRNVLILGESEEVFAVGITPEEFGGVVLERDALEGSLAVDATVVRGLSHAFLVFSEGEGCKDEADKNYLGLHGL